MVVDCGGGTVDITVHEIINESGQLKEVFKATGGPYGSVSEYIIDLLWLKALATCSEFMRTVKCFQPSTRPSSTSWTPPWAAAAT